MANNNIDIEKLKSYINDLEEKITPLTKSKKPDAKPDQEVNREVKRTYAVTDKKKEQLEKARAKRKENLDNQNKIKKLESAKLLLENEISRPEVVRSNKASPVPPPQTSESEVEESQSESSSEEEVVIIKKQAKKPKAKADAKSKPKKKPSKTIIIESSSESESESESE